MLTYFFTLGLPSRLLHVDSLFHVNTASGSKIRQILCKIKLPETCFRLRFQLLMKKQIKSELIP